MSLMQRATQAANSQANDLLILLADAQERANNPELSEVERARAREEIRWYQGRLGSFNGTSFLNGWKRSPSA